MKILKIVVIVLAVIFIAIQFFRPEKNNRPIDPAVDISAVVPVPPEISAMLKESCYDCHSNSTRYPWYAEVMPAGWYLADHVAEGTRHLNLTEFGAGSPRRQYHKLEEISEQLTQEKMPLPSYLILHADARLSEEQRRVLIAWVETSRESMRARYPVDSLERPRR